MTLQKNEENRAGSRCLFLVASPYATRLPYERSVILLVRSELRGVTGIFMDSEVREALKQLRQDTDGPEAPVAESVASQLKLRVVNWPTHELQAELEQGLWLTTPALQEDLLREDDLWVELVRRVGREVLQDSLGIEEFPTDPTFN